MYFLKILFSMNIPIAINSPKINIPQVDSVNIIGDFIMKYLKSISKTIKSDPKTVYHFLLHLLNKTSSTFGYLKQQISSKNKSSLKWNF